MITFPAVVVFAILLSSTLQECLEKPYMRSIGCGYQRYSLYDRIRSCNTFYKLNCYDVRNKLESRHKEDVHEIIVHSGVVKSLTSELFNGFYIVKSVTMTHANITNIYPNTFFYLPQLQSVDLSNNALVGLSQNSFKSVSLEKLDLSNNNINTVEYNSFGNITELILHHNKITNISNIVATCISLKTLDLSYNILNTIELSQECFNLMTLIVVHSNLKKFTVNSNQPLIVNTLNLSWNNLSDISSMNLHNMVELSNLNLSHNPLFQVKSPSINLFQNTLRLQLLDLSSTGIQKLDLGIFSRLSGLRALYLSENNLTTLPKGIFLDLISLNQLYLNGNHLKHFQYDGLPRLSTIDLSANLLTCHALANLINTLTSKSVRIIIGNTRSTTNIFGINCLDARKDSSNSTDHFNSYDNEYLFLNKFEEIIRRSLLGEGNITHLLMINEQTKNDAYWKNLTQDYKDFIQTIRQSIEDVLYKITEASVTLKNASTIKIDHPNLESLEHWKLFQRNFTEILKADRSNFLEAIRNSFEILVSNIRNYSQENNYYIKEANTSKNLAYKADALLPMSSDVEDSNGQTSYKALVIGTYGIFVVLLVGLLLLLLSNFKSWKIAKTKNDEYNLLEAFSDA
ncbi:hypothetical protein Trydic_g3415 [Trypoxylus dichotomus]